MKRLQVVGANGLRGIRGRDRQVRKFRSITAKDEMRTREADDRSFQFSTGKHPSVEMVVTVILVRQK